MHYFFFSLACFALAALGCKQEGWCRTGTDVPHQTSWTFKGMSLSICIWIEKISRVPKTVSEYASVARPPPMLWNCLVIGMCAGAGRGMQGEAFIQGFPSDWRWGEKGTRKVSHSITKLFFPWEKWWSIFSLLNRMGSCPYTKAFHHAEDQADSFCGLSKHLGVDRLKICQVRTCLPTSRHCMHGTCFNAEIRYVW